jgi:hypothetical protein
MTEHNSFDYIRAPSKTRAYEARIEDPYLNREKLEEPTHCPDCGAVYHEGRWQWGPNQKNSTPYRCPACARIHDKVPAGLLSLSGPYILDHKEEIMNLIKNREQQEKTEHPLERIMNIDETRQGEITIYYTGVHLTRGTGEALRHAYQGELDITHNDRDGQIRVKWQR